MPDEHDGMLIQIPLDAYNALVKACASDGKSGGLAKNGPDLLEKVAAQLEAYGLLGYAPCLRIKAEMERAALGLADVEMVDA